MRGRGAPPAAHSARLCDPEYIHPRERVRKLRFERVETREIPHLCIVGISRGVKTRDVGTQYESFEAQAERIEMRSDSRQREAVLLHMEQQVAAFGGHVEVAAQREPRERIVALAEQRLPAAAYVVARRTIAALRDERSRGDDVGARALAVETDQHVPARH